MKLLQTFFAALFLSGVTTQAALYTSYNSGTLNTVVPDGNPNGIAATINVSGFASGIQDVNVFINVSAGFNGDLYGYLSFGNTIVVLLNRIGKTSSDPMGSSTAGFGSSAGGWYNFKFDDAAATDIHAYNSGSPITGSYQPDRRTANPQSVLDSSSRGSPLASFNNLNPDGNWTLFLADMAGGGGAGSSTLVSWGLEIAPVSEKVNLALGIFAGLGLICAAWRSHFWLRSSKIKVRAIGILH